MPRKFLGHKIKEVIISYKFTPCVYLRITVIIFFVTLISVNNSALCRHHDSVRFSFTKLNRSVTADHPKLIGIMMPAQFAICYKVYQDQNLTKLYSI